MSRNIQATDRTASRSTAKAAGLLLQARRLRQPIKVPPTDCEPHSPVNAYAIQDAVAARLWGNKTITGWKTGVSSPEAAPVAAPIGPPLIYASDTPLPAANFQMRGIEVELAYRLQYDLPPRNSDYDLAQITDAIASVHTAIEIVDTRFAHWDKVSALWKLADFQSNGALIVGDALDDWRQIDPLQQRALLRVNGAIVADTIGGNLAGDPLPLLVWVVNHCATRYGGLHAGDLITTGTCTGLHLAPGSADIKAEFPGLPEVVLRFV